MINWTPLGTHPEVEKPKIPEALQLIKIMILLISLGLITGEFIVMGKVSSFTYGLNSMGLTIVTLIDCKHSWQSSGYLGRFIDLSLPTIFFIMGLSLIFKSQWTSI